MSEETKLHLIHTYNHFLGLAIKNMQIAKRGDILSLPYNMYIARHDYYFNLANKVFNEYISSIH